MACLHALLNINPKTEFIKVSAEDFSKINLCNLHKLILLKSFEADFYKFRLWIDVQ